MNETGDLTAQVAAAKAAWRRHAASLSWEEKVAAIERMRECDVVLKREREKLHQARHMPDAKR